MALFRITTKRTQTVNCIRIEKGMSVEVVHGRNESNPYAILSTLEGKEKVARAFMVKYGIDAKKACILDRINLECQLVG